MQAPTRTIRIRAGQVGQDGYEWSAPNQIDFSVTQTKRSAPNKAKIVLYNLSIDSINFLRKKSTQIYLSVGEDEIPSLLFAGQISSRGVTVSRTDAGTQTEILAADGLRQYAKSTLSASYPRGTSRSTILSDVLEAMGLPIGYKSSLEAKSYPGGWSFCGRAGAALDELLDEDADWSIQSGSIQIVATGDKITGTAPLFTPSSGLVGSPSLAGKEKVSVETVLRPDIHPGRLFRVESAEIQGDFVATAVQHTGGDGGNLWRSQITGKFLDA